MKDEEKTKSQLIAELTALRQRVNELEKSESARREAEKALHESETKFRSLAENATAAIFLIQGEKYVYVNPALTAMTGYTFEDLSSMNFWDFIAPDMRDLVKARGLGRQKKEDLPSRYELRFITKSGEERSGSFSATLIEFQNMPAILGTVVDVTEQKRIEKALRDSEQKYRELVEESNSIILRMDVTGKVTFFNEFAQRFFGYSEDEIVGKNVVGTIVPHYESTGRNLHSMIQQIGLNPQLYATNVNENMRRTGERVWIAWINKPLFDKTGIVTEILCVGNDITERKRTEDLLRQSEERYRTIFENSVMGIFQTTPEGRYLKANRELAWMLGHESPEEMIANVTDIGQQQYVHPEDRMKLKELYEYLGVVHRFETQMYRRDGTKMWISLNGRAVKGKDGKIVYYEGTIEDITERKQAEDLMRIQHDLAAALNTTSNLEEGLSLCLEGAMKASGTDCGGIYLTDPQSGILNLVCHRGLSSAFVKSNSRFDADAPNTVLVMTGENVYSEYSSLGIPDVEEGLTEGLQAVAIIPIRNVDRIIIGSLNVASHTKSEIPSWSRVALETIASEISSTISRLMVQSALKDSERRFRELADLLPQIGFELDDTGCITFMNRHALERYGYTFDDLNQNPSIFSYLMPEDRNKAQTIALRILKGEAIDGIELTALKKNGASFPVLVYATPIESSNDIVGIRGIAIDISDHKVLEEQLHHAQKMQSIGTLAGGIAHDFNNLLTTILGCGQLLLMKTEFHGKTRTYLERIMEAAESAAQLTQDLLAFSRKQVSKPVVVDPSKIIDKIERMAIRTIGDNIALKVVHGGSNLRIMADINQMEQVLMNIIINARDAMPEGGVLTIQIEQVRLNEDFTERHGGGKPGDYVRIAITDNGIGMAPDTLERIFEPFFTTKGVGKGTGLGLSIVFGIIRKHNGYVTVSSQLEKGTTVEVYLPLTDIADKIQTPIPNAVHFEKGIGTILIAEDDQLMLNMLKTILEEGGYKVFEAVDGDDALQKYIQNKDKIDMVILDVMMPKKNAKAVYDVIKVMDPFQKVLFVSGYTPEYIEKSGIFREDFNLIRKPFLPDLLLRKVREVFAR